MSPAGPHVERRPLEFAECDSCYGQVEARPLCAGCAHNRASLAAFMVATEPKLNGARTRALAVFEASKSLQTRRPDSE